MASKDCREELVWSEFAVTARGEMSKFIAEDSDLRQLLSGEQPPLERVDAVGRPLPMSGVIAKHPDVANFRRVLEIRIKRSVQDGDTQYQAYAKEVLKFLESLSPSASLFVVLVASKNCVYEVLFCPESGAVHGSMCVA